MQKKKNEIYEFIFQENGEILFGLSYLPTAERLSFSLTKAHNLKVPTDELENFGMYTYRYILVYAK